MQQIAPDRPCSSSWCPKGCSGNLQTVLLAGASVPEFIAERKSFKLLQTIRGQNARALVLLRACCYGMSTSIMWLVSNGTSPSHFQALAKALYAYWEIVCMLEIARHVMPLTSSA